MGTEIAEGNTSGLETLGQTFPYNKVENLAIQDAKEQITRWYAAEGGVLLATLISEYAVASQLGGISRFLEAITHFSIPQFVTGFQEIISTPLAQSWNNPETLVAWAGAFLLTGTAMELGMMWAVDKSYDTNGGHNDELDTIKFLLDKPTENRNNVIDTLDTEISNIDKNPARPPWASMIASCKDSIQKPKKTLLKWQNELQKAVKWDKRWNKNTDKLLTETQEAYQDLELATALQSAEFAAIDPSQARRNLTNKILDRIGLDSKAPIMDAIMDDYSTDTMKDATTAIREWAGNSKRTHTLKADLTYKESFDSERIDRITTGFGKSIESAESNILGLESDKARVSSQYDSQISSVTAATEAEKQNAINNLRSKKMLAIASIDSDIATQQGFINDTSSATDLINDLIDLATHNITVTTKDELLAPYNHEDAINQYYANNS